VLATLVGIIALWSLAACGDSEPDSVVTTIDSDVEIVEEPEDSIPIVGNDDGRGLDTVAPPDGLEAPPVDPAEPPAAEYSPSERQSRQERAVSEIEVLPEPGDDASAPEPAAVDEAVETVEGSAIRPDLDQFPVTIPVIVPGNDGTTTPQTSSADAGAQPRIFDANLFGTAAEIEEPVATANDELGGVEPPEPVIETEPDDEASAADGPSSADDCLGIEDCDSLVFGDQGLGVATGSDTVDTDQPDCAARPWAKGCPGPAPDYKGSAAVDAPFADTAPDEETEEGVFVPQEIQDALLAPVD